MQILEGVILQVIWIERLRRTCVPKPKKQVIKLLFFSVLSGFYRYFPLQINSSYCSIIFILKIGTELMFLFFLGIWQPHFSSNSLHPPKHTLHKEMGKMLLKFFHKNICQLIYYSRKFIPRQWWRPSPLINVL